MYVVVLVVLVVVLILLVLVSLVDVVPPRGRGEVRGVRGGAAAPLYVSDR